MVNKLISTLRLVRAAYSASLLVYAFFESLHVLPSKHEIVAAVAGGAAIAFAVELACTAVLLRARGTVLALLHACAGYVLILAVFWSLGASVNAATAAAAALLTATAALPVATARLYMQPDSPQQDGYWALMQSRQWWAAGGWLMPCAGAAGGGWLGAVLVPLDWQAPWQRWPISACYGMLAGNVLGHVLALLCCCGALSPRKLREE